MKNSGPKKKRIMAHGIDRVIMLILPILIVGLVVMTLVSTQSYRKEQIEFAYEVLQNKSGDLAVQLQGIINDKMADLTLLSEFDEVKAIDGDSFYDFIDGKEDIMGFKEIFMTDMKGLFYLSSTKSMVNRSGSDAYKNMMSSFKHVSDFYTIDGEGPYITLSTAIFDEYGERVGTIGGVMYLDYFDIMMKNNSTLLDGVNFLVNSKGKIMLSTDDYAFGIVEGIYDNPDNSVELITSVIKDGGNSSGRVKINGVEYFASADNVASHNWTIVSLASMEKVRSTISKALMVQHLLVSSLILVSLCIGHVITKWNISNRKNDTDFLTGVGSYSFCSRMILRSEERKNHDVTVVYCDMDRFKYVNDTMGHDVGDLLLKVFSEALEKAYGDIGFVGRMGGDEFIVFVEDKSEEEVRKRWEMLEEDLEKASNGLSFDYRIHSSHGIATRKAGNSTHMNVIVKNAENIMYEEKSKNGLKR